MKIGVEHRATKLPFASLLSSDGYARYGRPLCLRSSIVDQKPQKDVDLDRCTCWAGMRKRWRNTSPYPCVHHPCPSVHGQPNALTCLRAWMHQPLLSWVVYVRAHQITLACLHAPGGLQSAEIPPAGHQAVSSTREQISTKLYSLQYGDVSAQGAPAGLT